MIDYYRAILEKQLDKQYKRVYLRHIKKGSDWGSLPKSVIPRRNYHLKFVSNLWRRKGYLLVVNIKNLLDFLGHPKLGPVARTILQDRLCRGLPWSPLTLPLDGTQAKGISPDDWKTAAFMGEQGQEEVRMQAYHVDGSPANLDCLKAIQCKGITPVNGTVPLTPDRITISY